MPTVTFFKPPMETNSSLPRLVPWASWDEWQTTMDALFSEDSCRVRLGLETVAAWRTRGELPAAIEATADIIGAKMDGIESNEKKQQLHLSMVIIRLVNGLTDPSQKRAYALSVKSIADNIGLPCALVDIRHEATHSRLPTLPFLRFAADEALNYLYHHYWLPQLTKSHNPTPTATTTPTLTLASSTAPPEQSPIESKTCARESTSRGDGVELESLTKRSQKMFMRAHNALREFGRGLGKISNPRRSKRKRGENLAQSSGSLVKAPTDTAVAKLLRALKGLPPGWPAIRRGAPLLIDPGLLRPPGKGIPRGRDKEETWTYCKIQWEQVMRGLLEAGDSIGELAIELLNVSLDGEYIPAHVNPIHDPALGEWRSYASSQWLLWLVENCDIPDPFGLRVLERCFKSPVPSAAPVVTALLDTRFASHPARSLAASLLAKGIRLHAAVAPPARFRSPLPSNSVSPSDLRKISKRLRRNPGNFLEISQEFLGERRRTEGDEKGGWKLCEEWGGGAIGWVRGNDKSLSNPKNPLWLSLSPDSVIIDPKLTKIFKCEEDRWERIDAHKKLSGQAEAQEKKVMEEVHHYENGRNRYDMNMEHEKELESHLEQEEGKETKDNEPDPYDLDNPVSIFD